MIFSTPTQFAALALCLVAGWLFGLASHPGGRKWKERFRAEQAAHKATREEISTRDARLRELDRDSDRGIDRSTDRDPLVDRDRAVLHDRDIARDRDLARDRDIARDRDLVRDREPTLSMAPLAASAATAAAATPSRRGFLTGGRDDLSRIRGIDEATETALHAEGIKTYAAIEALTPEQEAALEERMDMGRGRIGQQQWREQAAVLNDGDDVEHQRRWG